MKEKVVMSTKQRRLILESSEISIDEILRYGSFVRIINLALRKRIFLKFVFVIKHKIQMSSL